MNFIKTAVLQSNVIPQHQQSKTLIEGLFFENLSKSKSGRQTSVRRPIQWHIHFNLPQLTNLAVFFRTLFKRGWGVKPMFKKIVANPYNLKDFGEQELYWNSCFIISISHLARWWGWRAADATYCAPRSGFAIDHLNLIIWDNLQLFHLICNNNK